jgi:hypothetical protein
MNYKRKPFPFLLRILPAIIALSAIAPVAPALAAPATSSVERGDAAFLLARDAFRNGERVRLGRQLRLAAGPSAATLGRVLVPAPALDDRRRQRRAGLPGAPCRRLSRREIARRLAARAGQERRPGKLPARTAGAGPARRRNQLLCTAQAAGTDRHGAPAVEQQPGSAAGLRATGRPAGGGRRPERGRGLAARAPAVRSQAGRRRAQCGRLSAGQPKASTDAASKPSRRKPARHLDKLLPAGMPQSAADAKSPCLPCSAWRAATRRMRPSASAASRRTSPRRNAPTPGARSPWQAAQRHLPEALAWYDKAAATPLSEEQMAWQVRAALRAGDWGAVQRAIAAMPPALAAQPDWIYWQAAPWPPPAGRRGARQLPEDQRPAEFLRQPRRRGTRPRHRSAGARRRPERRGSQPRPPPIPASSARWRCSASTCASRACANGSGRCAAWTTAPCWPPPNSPQRNEVWDRAINTADRTLAQHNYSLRYIAPFSDQVRPKADRSWRWTTAGCTA